MLIHVYILYSRASDIFYVGISNNIDLRLKQHNAGKQKFTKGHRPWIVVHQEPFQSYRDARSREKYLKSAAGRRWIRNQGFI